MNGIRTIHHHTQMPAVIDALQASDESMHEDVVKTFHKVGMCFNYMKKIGDESAQDIKVAVEKHKKDADSQLFSTFVLCGRSPMPLPDDLPVREKRVKQTVAQSSVLPPPMPSAQTNTSPSPAAREPTTSHTSLPPPPPLQVTLLSLGRCLCLARSLSFFFFSLSLSLYFFQENPGVV